MSRADTTEGFGLVEAIVALLVVGLAAVALFDLITGTATRGSMARARWEGLVSARAALRMQLDAPPGREGWRRLVGPDGAEWWARTTPSTDAKRLLRVDVAKRPGAPALASTLALARTAP